MANVGFHSVVGEAPQIEGKPAAGIGLTAITPRIKGLQRALNAACACRISASRAAVWNGALSPQRRACVRILPVSCQLNVAKISLYVIPSIRPRGDLRMGDSVQRKGA